MRTGSRIALAWAIFAAAVPASNFAAERCEVPKSANDLLECVKLRHYSVQLEKQALTSAEHDVSAARAFRNPELELESVPDPAGGWEHDGKLQFALELGGKRSSRSTRAESAVSVAKAGLLREQESAVVEIVTNLYRLRQIRRELEIAQETHETFQSITSTYARAGRLGPEQEVSLTAFRLASDESNLRILSLSSEQQEVLSAIEGAVGVRLPADVSALLPDLKSDWPELKEGRLGGSSVDALRSSVDLAQAEYSFEKAQAWPDLFVGPAFRISNAPGGESRLGVALTFDLPVLSLNSGGRARALAELDRAELARNLHTTRLERELSALRAAYKSSSVSMRTIIKNDAVDARHGSLHQLLRRGVISAPLVIELHRQISEYTEKVHEVELTGIGSLWRIYALEGRILNEAIK